MIPKLIVLCGGRGLRLGKLTEDIPKPLVPINGKPVLQHAMEIYMRKGIKDYIFCVGYKGEKIIDAFRNFPAGQIEFLNSGDNASMLKRIYDVRDKISDMAIVAYGDTVTDLDLMALLETHKKNKNMITLVVSKTKVPFGIIEVDEEYKVTSFKEKPVFDYFIGFYAINKEIFEYITPELIEKPDSQGLLELFQSLIKKRKAGIFYHHGLNLTFNTPIEKKEMEEKIPGFYYTQLEEFK